MYPVTYEADFNPEPDRLTTFFRLILADAYPPVGLEKAKSAEQQQAVGQPA